MKIVRSISEYESLVQSNPGINKYNVGIVGFMARGIVISTELPVLYNCVFDNCTFIEHSIELVGGSVTGSVFISGGRVRSAKCANMRGIKAPEGWWSSDAFEGSDFRGSTFCNATFESLIGCDIRNTSFIGCSMHHASISQCYIDASTLFINCKLKDTIISGIGMSEEDIIDIVKQGGSDISGLKNKYGDAHA